MTMKKNSIFYSEDIIKKIKSNIEKYPYLSSIGNKLEAEAEPWMKFTDDELWNLMFGNTLERSWMVWSNGFCPSCKRDVLMYTWIIDPLKHPWKVQCPHCGDLFPKNDFYKYYTSGLDESNIFQYELADESLLFNTEHPDISDPLHKFGVDDGKGYVDLETGNRWRFVGTYLIYGQWKTLIVKGIDVLANAYVVTGNTIYAHKAGILLDRIADLYPAFDFGEQGILYEKKGHSGYVSTWHDANIETKTMAIAYDRIFDAIKNDKELIIFLSEKAEKFGLENKKQSFEDIQENIEKRILEDAISNRSKITFNFPLTDTTIILLKTVLYWHEKRDEIEDAISDIIVRATAVDGVTGEKGLANYSALTMNKFAEFLVMYELVDKYFLKKTIQKHPSLKDTYKFFIDTWCLERYYPRTGDTGAFAHPNTYYRGVWFENCFGNNTLVKKEVGTEPSMYTFMWKLYKATGNSDYIKIIYKNNNNSTTNLPYDITAENPYKIEQEITKIIETKGTKINPGSINKEEWHLAILRSGKAQDERDLWIDYDSGYSHGHSDGMNVGLFAKGLDLMPDFGYLPVQFGGWHTPKAKWYGMTAAHNTVVVDCINHNRQCGGKTTLWAIGDRMKAIRVSAPELINGKQFERTVALIDITKKDSYILDVFRVVGGTDHARFMHSHHGSITSNGLLLEPADDYGYNTLMRNFRGDKNPSCGWSVDWEIEDYLNLVPDKTDLHLKYTDLTSNASAYICEGWISAGDTKSKIEKWIPRIMIRRQSEKEPLVSNFVGIIEPYENKSNIKDIRRLELQYEDESPALDSDVAVEVVISDARKDLIISTDSEDPLLAKKEKDIVIQKEWRLKYDGELCLVSMNHNEIERIIICRGTMLNVRGVDIRLKSKQDIFEVVFNGDNFKVIVGKNDDIEKINKEASNGKIQKILY